MYSGASVIVLSCWCMSVVIKRKFHVTIQSLLEVIIVNEGRKGQNVFRETCVHIQSVVEIRCVSFLRLGREAKLSR